jgi:hypothetical protein
MPKRGAKCAYPKAIWAFPRQAFTSANTSRKQLPALMGKETAPYVEYKRGTKNADIGGGRFDMGTQALKKLGVKNYVYDPYNRSAAHNDAVVDAIRCGQAHTATVSNVLNVIREAKVRQQVIQQAADAVGCKGTAYFYIYPGEGKQVGSGGRETTKGNWQEFRAAKTYIPELKKVFKEVWEPGDRKKRMLVARNPKAGKCGR